MMSMWKSVKTVNMVSHLTRRVSSVIVKPGAIAGRFFTTPTRKMSGPGVSNMSDMHNPSPFQKRILVWAKMYTRTEDVPERVTTQQMKKAMDLFRIRCNILMIIATLIGCYSMITYGRRLRDSGDSLTERTNQQIAGWKEKERQQKENEPAATGSK